MERLEKHQTDYKPKAYENYSINELADWIHLFAKRASHRTTLAKRKKDLYDAKNYMLMLKLKLEKTCSDLGIDFDGL